MWCRMRNAEPSGEGVHPLFPALDTLVAAAGVDEMLAAREKDGKLKTEPLHGGHPPIESSVLMRNRVQGDPNSWRLTFGNSFLLPEIQQGSTRTSKMTAAQPEATFRRGNRRKATTGARTVSQLAVERRKFKDMEIGLNMRTSTGGLNDHGSRKREGHLRTDYHVDSLDHATPSKKQALVRGSRDPMIGEVELLDSGMDDEDDWKPPQRMKSSLKFRESNVENQFGASDKPNVHRRRGRPPGSGNRKPMEPQRIGPDGTKKFNLRSAQFTGVYRTPAGRWRAQFCHRGQVVQLGMYDNEDSAARRWDMEAIRLRGDNTQLNFPELKALYVSRVQDAEKYNLGYDVDLPKELLSITLGDANHHKDLTMDSESPHDGCGDRWAGGNRFAFPKDPRIQISSTEMIAAPVPVLEDETEKENPPDESASDEAPQVNNAGELGNVRAVPKPMLSQMRMMLEGIVRAADKDIRMANSRIAYASQVIHYGESLRREAQTCVGLYDSRREAAVKLLENFQSLLSSTDTSSQLED